MVFTECKEACNCSVAMGICCNSKRKSCLLNTQPPKTTYLPTYQPTLCILPEHLTAQLTFML